MLWELSTEVKGHMARRGVSEKEQGNPERQRNRVWLQPASKRQDRKQSKGQELRKVGGANRTLGSPQGL